MNRFTGLKNDPMPVLQSQQSAGIAARVDTMNAFAGLAALVIALVGCVLLTEMPTRAEHAELIESGGQSDGLPPYLHFDLDDWRVS
jgi:hypothetical protein